MPLIKEIVKDARLQHWVAEEMGLIVTWPFTLKTDSLSSVLALLVILVQSLP